MYNSYGIIYRSIKDCGDNAPKLLQILDDHNGIFAKAKGSMHNHQVWEGGYLQHVADTMTIARHIYSIEWDMPFTWSSVVLVLFLHDIEKPFMQERMANDHEMPLWNKAQRLHFKTDIIANYKIELSDEERMALFFIEGEGDAYSPTKRVMNELGALCHAADILSARLWHSRNKPE